MTAMIKYEMRKESFHLYKKKTNYHLTKEREAQTEIFM